jgi:dihydroflavonol-4-reductase
VREPDNPDKTGHLVELGESLPGTLRLFAADLLEEGSYAEAMAGCRIVLHTASPFLLRFEDAQKELIEPAVQGTRNVLEEAKRTASVRRVVVTSSCAAIYGDNADIDGKGRPAFTEADWNTTSTVEHKPYSLSKTLAEREAWKIAEAQERWQLLVMNPSLVLGPGIQARSTSGSFELIRDLGNGTLKAGVPVYPFGAVDVRDVAEGHVKAALDEKVPSGRYILSGHDTDLFELARMLLPQFGDRYPLPRRKLPKWLVWLVGPLVDRSLTRKVIARNVGVRAGFDRAKSERLLGLRYRSLETSVVEMVAQLEAAGLLEKSASR